MVVEKRHFLYGSDVAAPTIPDTDKENISKV